MQDDKPEEPEELDLTSLADALLGKDKEEEKPDEKPEEEAKAEEAEKTDEKPAEVDGDKKTEEEKPEDKPKDPAAGDKPVDGEAEADKSEDKPAEEDTKPLSREDIKNALREEQEERERVSSERTTFQGKVREDLKEALKPDSTFTEISLEDGTPITSVSQLTQVINPDTEEPYTREEAQSLILEAKEIVQKNLEAYEKRVDELTDLNVNFKEQSDEVDRLYGDILKAFPEEAKAWLEAYQKTFKVSEDGTYVEDVPISPLEFYKPILAPYRNATDQLIQKQAEEKAAEEKAAKAAEVKIEQEDRGDLGGNAGSAQGKPNLLADALDKYLAN
jgi:hypothetical protein